jgi:sialic acid synthase SpsE
MNTIKINGHTLNGSDPPFVIAEAGANHDGELSKAKRLIDAAVGANADAIKFQNYTAEKLVTRSAKKYWGDRETTQYETFAELDVLSSQDYEEMADYADESGITYLSTPFDREAVDLLNDHGVPAFKIASGDLTYHSLLEYVAKQGKPVILSTGMATLEEIKEAVGVIESTGNDKIVLLHCITKYPTPIEHTNLRQMETLMKSFEYPVGLSDHTLGTTVPTAVAAMGAAVIEKHFTFDTSLEKSPDHRLSADVEEMKDIVQCTRDVHKAMGSPEVGPIDLERESIKKARRSLVTARKIEEDERIRTDDLSVKRPGWGIEPKYLSSAEEERWVAATTIEADSVLIWDYIDRGDVKTELSSRPDKSDGDNGA